MNRLYQQLRDDVARLDRKNERQDTRTERAEYAGAVEAFTLASAPTTTGLGDNVSYTSLAWISNGRKPGEGAGTGTGVLAWFNASDSTWYSVFDQAAVIV